MGENNFPGGDVVVTHNDLVLSPGADEKGVLLSPMDDPEKAKPVEEREQWKDPVQVNPLCFNTLTLTESYLICFILSSFS